MEAAPHRVGHIGALRLGEQGDGGVSLGRQDVHQGVGVAVQRDGGAWLEELPVQRGQDAHVVVGPCAVRGRLAARGVQDGRWPDMIPVCDANAGTGKWLR